MVPFTISMDMMWLHDPSPCYYYLQYITSISWPQADLAWPCAEWNKYLITCSIAKQRVMQLMFSHATSRATVQMFRLLFKSITHNTALILTHIMTRKIRFRLWLSTWMPCSENVAIMLVYIEFLSLVIIVVL